MILRHDNISEDFSCEIQVTSVEFVQKQRREEYHKGKCSLENTFDSQLHSFWRDTWLRNCS